MLGVRNQEAMEVSNEKIGSVWNGNKIGSIYKDNFFYTSKDFGWLKSVSGANQVKSLVSGVGMKVTKNNGENISFSSKPSKWKDATLCKNWILDGDKNKCKLEKKIDVKRVAYYEENGKKYELGDELCMLKVKDNNGGKADDIYLLVGLAEVNRKGTRGAGHDWEWTGEQWFKKLHSCEILKRPGWNKVKLKIERHGLEGDRGVSKDKWVMVLGSTGTGIVDFNNGRGGKSIVGVVLGLVGNWAINGTAWKSFETLEDEWWGDKFVEVGASRNSLRKKLGKEFKKKQETIHRDWKVNDNWDALNEGGVLNLEKIRSKNWIKRLGEWTGDMEIQYEWNLKK